MRTSTRSRRYGQVAQLVEQRTENPRVGGSIPPLATIPISLRQDLINLPFVIPAKAGTQCLCDAPRRWVPDIAPRFRDDEQNRVIGRFALRADQVWAA